MYLVDHVDQPFLKEVINMFAIFGILAVLVTGTVVLAENHSDQKSQETTQEAFQHHSE